MVTELLLVLSGVLIYAITLNQICSTIERCHMIKYWHKIDNINFIERED